jgi:hypothetical protein
MPPDADAPGLGAPPFGPPPFAPATVVAAVGRLLGTTEVLVAFRLPEALADPEMLPDPVADAFPEVDPDRLAEGEAVMTAVCEVVLFHG